MGRGATWSLATVLVAVALAATPSRATPLVTPEFSVAVNAAGRPSAAHNGRWGLVAWVSAGEVMTQVIDASGLPVGAPFRVCSAAACSGMEHDPVVAEPIKDTFLIVWQDDRNGASAEDLYGARIFVAKSGAATGLDPSGLLLSLATLQAPRPSDDGPAYQIASDRQGLWLLAYSGDDTGLATRISADGMVLDLPAVPVTAPGRFDAFIRSSYGRDGKFLLSWVDRHFDPDGGEVFGAIVTASAFAAPSLAAAVQLSQREAEPGEPRKGGQDRPTAGFLVDRFLVAWEDDHLAQVAGTGHDVFARLVGLDGRAQGADVIPIVRDPRGRDGLPSTSRQSAPTLTSDGGGHLLAYLDGHPFDGAGSALRVRHLGADGRLLECLGPFDPGFTVAGSGSASDLALTTTEPVTMISVRRGQWILYFLRDAKIRGRVVSFAPHAPTADAGVDRSISWCTNLGSPVASVTVSGRASDPDACDTITQRWTDKTGRVLGSGESSVAELPVGVHDLTLTASDGALETTDTVKITVTGVTCEALTVTGAVTCDAGGGAGKVRYTTEGGLGAVALTGTPDGQSIVHGSAWTVIATDQSGNRAPASGVIDCPFACPAASACDGALDVDVQVACNPLALEHALDVSTSGGSGLYQICGDAAGGATVRSGETWRVLVTDRQTGACGLAEGTATCAAPDPTCPTVSLAAAPVDVSICEGGQVSSALLVSPGTGGHSVRWLAGDAPIGGATTASLDWSAASPDGCGEDDVHLSAEVTCVTTGQVGRFPAGRVRVQAAPRAPSGTVADCTTRFVPACPGDALAPAEYTADDDEAPGTAWVSVTPAGSACAPAWFDVATAGCNDCVLDAAELVTSSPTEFCAGSGQSRIVDARTGSSAPKVQYLLSDAAGLIVLPINTTGHFDLTALPVGGYRLFAAASTEGVSGQNIFGLVAVRGCYSLTPPLVITVASCACPQGCDDFDACTVDRCDEATRRCVNPARACDDGDACSGAETCDPAIGCLAGPALVCDDQDVCNGAETCDRLSGCRAGTSLQCDDAQSCNGLETCDEASGCVTTGALACDDGDPCNGAETCDGAGGCLPGTPPTCDDSDACNGAETCQPGVGCVAGAAILCADQDACNGAETCDPQTGACSAGAAPSCDDQDPCNGVETCDAVRGCVPGQPILCDDGDACNGAERCDPLTAGCGPAPAPFDCDDDNPCNGFETCDPASGCIAGRARDCSDGDLCTRDLCDLTSGTCQNPALGCDDGDACNGLESCAGNGCAPGTPPKCGDDDLCNGAEACLPTSGCVPPAPADCDDRNACTSDACDPQVGCTHTLDSAACAGARTVDLGPRLGTLVAATDEGGGCWSGSVGATPCLDLPFCTLIATACYDGNDQLTSVTLAADGTLGPFGATHFEGPWSASGWCLPASATHTQTLAGLAFTDVQATVCLDAGGAVSTSLAGDVQIAGAPVSLSGTFESDTGQLSVTLAGLALGALAIGDATLTLAGDPLTAHLNGSFRAGRGPASALLDVGGEVDSGDFTLALSLPEDATWTPTAGVDIAAVQGEIAWTGGQASAWIALDADVALAPLGSFLAPTSPPSSAARVATSSDGAVITGCIALPGPADAILAGLPLTELSPRLCFGADAQGDLTAGLALGGHIGLGPATPYDFTATWISGPSWRIVAQVAAIAAGGFDVDDVTLALDGSGAVLDGLVSVGLAPDPLRLAVTGPWKNSGVLALAASQPAADDWAATAEVAVTALAGSFARDTAGSWSATLTADADLLLGPFGTRTSAGTLVVTPDDAKGCLATQPFDQTLGAVQLNDLVVSACLGVDATGVLAQRFPMSGEVVVDGDASALTSGAYHPADDAWAFSVELAWDGLDLGIAGFTNPRLVLRAPLATPAAVAQHLLADLAIGAGAERLLLEVEGDLGAHGDLVLTTAMKPGTTWQPTPGVVIAAATGQLHRAAGVWSGSLDLATHADLGPLGSAHLDGTLTLEEDFSGLVGCVPGALADRSLGGFTLTEAAIDLCLTDDPDPAARVTIDVATDLTVADQTRAATGRYTPGDPWRLDLHLSELHLDAFIVQSVTFALAGTPGWPFSTVTAALTGTLVIPNVNKPLTLAVSGAWRHQADLTLTLALAAGASWTPAPALTFTTLSGALIRSGEAWSATLDALAPIDYGPFGVLTLGGALAVSPDARIASGCLGSANRYVGTIAGLGFADTAFEACLDPDPPQSPALTRRFAGLVTLESGSAPAAYDGLFRGPDEAPGSQWRLELDVPSLALGHVPLDAARIVASLPVATTTPVTALEIALTLGEGPAALSLEGGGPWTASGQLDLPLDLPPNTIWEPATDVLFDAVDGHYRRKNNLWTLTVGIDTTVNLGPFGLTAVAGEFTVGSDGETVTGCLTGDGPDQFDVGGFELRELEASLCLEDTAFGLALVPGLAGEWSLPADPIWYPVTIVVTGGAAWAVAMTVEELALDPYTLDVATFRVQSFGPPDNDQAISVEADKLLGGELALTLSGGWSHSDDIVLGIETEPAATWEPEADLVFEDIGGDLSRTDGTWRLELELTTALALDPFGMNELAGRLGVDDAGALFTGCLAATAPAGSTLTVSALDFSDARPGACFGSADGSDPDARTYPLAVQVESAGDPALGAHQPSFDPTLPADLDWRFVLELPPFAIGTWEALGREESLGVPFFDGESWYFGQDDDRTLGAGPRLTVEERGATRESLLGARLIAHPGVDGQDLVLDVDGPWAGDTRNLALPASQVEGTAWAPSPLAPELVFHSVTGEIERLSQAWSFAVEGIADVELEPFGAVSLTGPLTWGASVGVTGELEGPVALTELAGFPIDATHLQADFTVAPRGVGGGLSDPTARTAPPVDTLAYTASGQITWGAAAQSFEATYTPSADGSWALVITVENLVLGDYTLTQATLTITPDPATGAPSLAVTGHLVTELYDLTVNGAWSHPDDMIWSATGTATKAGGVAAIGAQVGGAFKRTAGTWSLDMSALTPVDLGPFGTIQLDGATKAEAEAAPTGVACDTFTRTSTPTLVAQPAVGGIAFSAVAFEACYDDATQDWTYDLAATVTMNGQPRQITATLTTQPNGIHVVGTLTNLVLGGGFSIPSVTLTFDWTKNTFDKAQIQGRIVLFGQPDTATALHLDVDAPWPKSGPFTLAVTMPADHPWKPNADLTATEIAGRIQKSGSDWSITLASTFQAYLGPQLGAYDLIGNFTIQSGGVFSACLATATGAMQSLNLAGVPLKQLRLEACFARTLAGAELQVEVGLSGKVDMRGTDFDFTAVYETVPAGDPDLPVGGWRLIASVKNLVLGEFQLADATLTFQNGGRQLEVFLHADLTLGGLQLVLDGAWKNAGDYTIGLAMKKGTSWQIGSSSAIAGATGFLKVYGTQWTVHVSVGTTLSFGPVTDVSVTGDLTMVKTAGVWKAQGCVAGALGANQTSALNPSGGNRGLSGSMVAKACFGSATTLSLTVHEWKPIPSLAFTVLDLELVYAAVPATEDTPAGWKLTAEAGPLASFDVGSGNNALTFTDTTFIGALVNKNNATTWSVGLRTHASFTFLDKPMALALNGGYDSATSRLSIEAVWTGQIQLLGRSDLALTNPKVTVSTTLGGAASVQIELSSSFSVTVFGAALTGTIKGGAAFGDDANAWFAGSLATPTPGGLDLPGFDPFKGSLCVAVASGSVAAQEICPGITTKLERGFRVMVKTQLPAKLVQNQPDVLLSIIMESGGKLTLEAKLDNLNWFIIQQGGNFPGFDWAKVQSLAFSATIDGASVAFGFEGTAELQPSDQPAGTPTIFGVLKISFTPTDQTLALQMYIDGRWYEPFGLASIAIENPGIALAIKLSSVPPAPTSVGVNMDLFWKKSGNWPPFIKTAETCSTLPACETGCGSHIKCQIQTAPYQGVKQIGGTVFVDVNQTPSGFCILGVCAPLPTLIFRLDVNNLALGDIITLMWMPWNVLATKLGDLLEGILPSSLADLALPTLPSTATLDIDTLSITVSTHNKTIFALPFTAGFRALLDMEIGNTDVFFDGYLGMKGLSAEGRIEPFTLLGQEFEGDPFAKYAALGASGYLQIAHESKLDFFAGGGTVEGWLQKDSTPQTTATFASKLGSTNGWAIEIGDPDATLSRVVIKARSGGQTRTVRTREGAIERSKRHHLAVVWQHSSQTFEVRVDGASRDLEEMNTPALAVGPANNASALVFGQGLALIDDVRLWNKELSGDDIQGRARILDPGFTSSADLVARWEIDFDKNGVAYNSRWYTGTDGQTTSKLHGSYLSGAAPFDDPADQDLFARLSLRLDQASETGVFIAAGTRITIPVLVPEGLAARGRVQLGDGKMFAEAYIRNFELLKLGNIGAFVIGGYGQNSKSGDFDDGVYARLQLKPQFAAEISASLAWGSVGSATIIGDATLGADASHVYASGNLNVTIDVPILGDTGLVGSFSFDTNSGMTISGKVVVASRELASAGIYVDSDKLTVTASISLGSIFGFSLGSPSIELTLDWGSGDLCGTVGWTWSDGSESKSCNVGVCIGLSGLDVNIDCGGISPCDADGDCAADKFCALGTWCQSDFEDGWGPCNRDGQCESGACGALFGSQCYQPHTKTKNELCFASDHCAQGLVCVDILNVGLCRTTLGYNDWGCESSNECASGLSCVDVGQTHRCVYTNLAYGESCQHNEECSSGECDGTCGCDDDDDCARGYYCDDDVCEERGPCGSSEDCPAGESCTQQLSGDWYCNPTEWSPQGGTCFSTSDCDITAAITTPICLPITAYLGQCACVSDSQCGSGYICDAATLTCVAKLGAYSSCTRSAECGSGLSCQLMSWMIIGYWDVVQVLGQPPSPAEYYSGFAVCAPTGTAALGASCYTNGECDHGLCTTGSTHVCVCDNRNDCAAPVGKVCDGGAFIARPTSTPYTGPFGNGCANDCECDDASKCVAPDPPPTTGGWGLSSSQIDSWAPGHCMPLESGEANACSYCQSCTGSSCARPGTPTTPRPTVCSRDSECPANWGCVSAFSLYPSGSGANFDMCMPTGCWASSQCASGLTCKYASGLPPAGSKFCLP